MEEIISDLEEQVRDLQDCSRTFLDKGLLGQHQEAEAELREVLETLDKVLGMAGRPKAAAVPTAPRPPEPESAGSPSPSSLRASGAPPEAAEHGVSPAPISTVQAPLDPKAKTASRCQKAEAAADNSETAAEMPRWSCCATETNVMQVAVAVEAGVRGSDILVEQEGGEVAVRVMRGGGEQSGGGGGPTAEAEPLLLRTDVPPRLADGGLRVKLSRKERLLRLFAELGTPPVGGLAPGLDPWRYLPGQVHSLDEAKCAYGETAFAEAEEALSSSGVAAINSALGSNTASALLSQALAALHAGYFSRYKPTKPEEAGNDAEAPAGSGTKEGGVDEGGAHLLLDDACVLADSAEIREAVGRIDGVVAGLLKASRLASPHLAREKPRLSAFGRGAEELAVRGAELLPPRVSGMPRVLAATLVLALGGGSGRAVSESGSPSAGRLIFNSPPHDSEAAGKEGQTRVEPLGLEHNRVVLGLCSPDWAGPSIELAGADASCVTMTVFYYDASRLGEADEKLQRQVQDAKSLVVSGSVAVYQAELERDPSNAESRWKVVQAALDSKQVDVAGSVAQEGLAVSPGEPLSWVMVGVVEQHRAAAAGGPSVKAGAEHLRKAAGAYRRALDIDEAHPDALRNILVCLEHLVELDELQYMAKKAVAAGAVPFLDPMQRPTVFLPGLRASPWWDPAEIPFVRRLEAAFAEVREEAAALFGLPPSDAGGWRKQQQQEEEEGEEEGGSGEGPGGASLLGHCDWRRAGEAGWRRTDAGKAGWRKVVAAGRWQELVLWGGGRRVDENCRLVPKTAALMASVPEAVSLAEARGGEILLSVLEPGSHLRAHCGPSNNRLTCHLGLHVPPGLSIRVAGDTRGWEEGRCIVFDDSFEHEVWHRGDRRRIVLMFNFWHPDITEEERGSSMKEYFDSTV